MMNLIFTIARFHGLGWDCEMPSSAIVGLDSFTSESLSRRLLSNFAGSKAVDGTYEMVITTSSFCALMEIC